MTTFIRSKTKESHRATYDDVYVYTTSLTSSNLFLFPVTKVILFNLLDILTELSPKIELRDIVYNLFGSLYKIEKIIYSIFCWR